MKTITHYYVGIAYQLSKPSNEIDGFKTKKGKHFHFYSNQLSTQQDKTY